MRLLGNLVFIRVERKTVHSKLSIGGGGFAGVDLIVVGVR